MHPLERLAHGASAPAACPVKTARNNVSSIFTKLQVADRAEAIARARRTGLGPGE